MIFNALIIIALVPLALRGVRYRPLGAAALLRRNLLIYGVGGIIAPFIGIKLIDVIITHIGWVVRMLMKKNLLNFHLVHPGHHRAFRDSSIRWLSPVWRSCCFPGKPTAN